MKKMSNDPHIHLTVSPHTHTHTHTHIQTNRVFYFLFYFFLCSEILALQMYTKRERHFLHILFDKYF